MSFKNESYNSKGYENLKSVIKNTDDKQLINNCKLEIKRRTTRRPINPS